MATSDIIKPKFQQRISLLKSGDFSDFVKTYDVQVVDSIMANYILKTMNLQRSVNDICVFIPIYVFDTAVPSYVLIYSENGYTLKKFNTDSSKICLFGLGQNHKSIITNDYVVICEGFFDFMALWFSYYKRTGDCFPPLVALLTNNISEWGLFILASLCKKLVCVLDNDEGGNIGYNRLKKLIANNNLDVSLLRINLSSKDPYDLVFNHNEINYEAFNFLWRENSNAVAIRWI